MVIRGKWGVYVTLVLYRSQFRPSLPLAPFSYICTPFLVFKLLCPFAFIILVNLQTSKRGVALSEIWLLVSSTCFHNLIFLLFHMLPRIVAKCSHWDSCNHWRNWKITSSTLWRCFKQTSPIDYSLNLHCKKAFKQTMDVTLIVSITNHTIDRAWNACPCWLDSLEWENNPYISSQNQILHLGGREGGFFKFHFTAWTSHMKRSTMISVHNLYTLWTGNDHHSPLSKPFYPPLLDEI